MKQKSRLILFLSILFICSFIVLYGCGASTVTSVSQSESTTEQSAINSSSVNSSNPVKNNSNSSSIGNSSSPNFEGEKPSTSLPTTVTLNGLTFTILDDNTYQVADFDNSSSIVVVPETVAGAKVTSIGEGAFWYCSSLTSVTIPNNVIEIASEAFYKCSSLTSVTIGNSVTSIGSEAFYGCNSLTSIEIPNSVISIGERAFYNCSSLTSVTLPFVGATKNGTTNTHFGYIFGASSYSNNSSYVPTSLKEAIITGGSSIGSMAFSCCAGLTSIEIPNSVTSIGNYAFDQCSSLINMIIPEKVTSIGELAFCNCSSLQSVTIGNRVTSIGYYAFYNCSSLTSIEIPNSVTNISAGAFFGCGLASVTFKNPNGWKRSDREYLEGISILATDLSNISIAATYLKSTYCYYYWKRN